LAIAIAKSKGDPRLRTGILGVFLLANAIAAFCVFNPWITEWRELGITFLIFEVVFVVVIGLPVLLYQTVWKRKSLKTSLSDSVKAVMDFLSHSV